jgi:hypothetical protein
MVATPFPKIAETVRPFRLWDANAKHPVRYRYYSAAKRAHLGALIEARWGAVGTVIEVYDARTAALLGQYRRTVSSVAFTDVRKLNHEGEESNGR